MNLRGEKIFPLSYFSYEQCIKEHERSFSLFIFVAFFPHFFDTFFTHKRLRVGGKNVCNNLWHSKKIFMIKNIFLRKKLFMARHYCQVSSAVIAEKKQEKLFLVLNGNISISSLEKCLFSHKFSTAFMHSLM